MKKKSIRILVLVGIMMGVSFGALKVNADTQTQTMRVSPRYQEMILTPGESYSGSMIVSNDNSSTRALKYAVSIGSFSERSDENGGDDYGTVDHVSVSSYNQIMDWVSFDKTSGTVEPNGKDEVTYTINVPEDAPGGGQYATIVFTDETNKDNDSGGNVMIQDTYQFASILYAEVAGETRKEGGVLENNIPIISFNTPLSVSSMVENNGNVHTDAKYTLEVRSLFSDEIVYSNAEDPKTSLILPETKRYNTQSWDEAPTVGIFKVKQIVEIFDKKSVSEKIVLMCPLWLLFIVIFVVVVIIVWLISRSVARKKEKLKKAE